MAGRSAFSVPIKWMLPCNVKHLPREGERLVMVAVPGRSASDKPPDYIFSLSDFGLFYLRLLCLLKYDPVMAGICASKQFLP